MNAYSWPDHGCYDPDRLRRAWPATIAALPVGARITGTVIARQPFGVFVAIDGVPAARASPRSPHCLEMSSCQPSAIRFHESYNRSVRSHQGRS